MSITYTVEDISNNATSVAVTYTDEVNNVYSRLVNVPYANGELDIVQWNRILEDHLQAVKYKLNIGVIKFVSPEPTP
jgi:hypothetical protein